MSSSSSSAAATFDTKDLAVHGLLAYIPAVSPAQNNPGVTYDPYPGRSYAAKPSYRAPPFKQQEARTIKSYQPFDMTGDSLYHGGPPKTKLFYLTKTSPASPPQTDSTIHSVPLSTPEAVTYRTPPPTSPPADTNFYNPPPKAPAVWSPPQQQSSDYGLSYNQTVASPASVPTYTAAVPAVRPSYDDDVASRPSVLKPSGGVTQDKSFWSTRKSYYNDADEPRACAQSRTFYILEAMLSEQGSGEQGLPPPPVHSGSHVEESPATVGSTPVVIGIHPGGVRPAPVSTATATANISLRQQAPADYELQKTAVRVMPATRPQPAEPHEHTAVTETQPQSAELPNTTTPSAPNPDIPVPTAAAPKREAQPETESKPAASGDLIDLGGSDSAPASSRPADGGPAATAASATENKAE